MKMKRMWEGFDLHDKPLPTKAWKAGFSNSSGLLEDPSAFPVLTKTRCY